MQNPSTDETSHGGNGAIKDRHFIVCGTHADFRNMDFRALSKDIDPHNLPLFRISLTGLTSRVSSLTLEDFGKICRAEVVDVANRSQIKTSGKSKEITMAIALSQGLPDIPAISLTVQEFKPEEGDNLKRIWKDQKGEQMELNSPPWGLANTEETFTRIGDHIGQSYLQWAAEAGGLFSQIKDLIDNKQTSKKARSMLEHLLKMCLMLLYKMGSAYLIGSDTLGIFADHEYPPLLGKPPAPRMISAQFDPLASHHSATYQTEFTRIYVELNRSNMPEDNEALVAAVYAIIHLGSHVFADGRRRAMENSAETLFLEHSAFWLIERSLIGHCLCAWRLNYKAPEVLVEAPQEDSPAFYYSQFTNFMENAQAKLKGSSMP
ncbi:hypothetical protein TruAng_012182 [Truncatella angustata]|nr:hypothetical protein TruAng_012182 [Truncatella angustata]